MERYSIGQDQPYSDSEGSFLASYGISDSGAILVRPDDFIAFHAQNATNRRVEAEDILLDLSRLLEYASPLSAL